MLKSNAGALGQVRSRSGNLPWRPEPSGRFDEFQGSSPRANVKKSLSTKLRMVDDFEKSLDAWSITDPRPPTKSGLLGMTGKDLALRWSSERRLSRTVR